jgi:hypothetical protein
MGVSNLTANKKNQTRFQTKQGSTAKFSSRWLSIQLEALLQNQLGPVMGTLLSQLVSEKRQLEIPCHLQARHTKDVESLAMGPPAMLRRQTVQ